MVRSAVGGAFRHLEKVERAAVVLLLDAVGDPLELGGRAVEFPGDLDPELRVAVNGVVIDHEMAVGGDDRAVGGDDERVDLGRPGVGRAGDPVEPGQKIGELGKKAPADADPDQHVPGLVFREAREHIDRLAGDLFGMEAGHLLDARAARRAEDEDRLLQGVVEDQPDEVLGGDRQLLLDEDPVDDIIADLHPQQAARLSPRPRRGCPRTGRRPARPGRLPKPGS